MRVRFPKIRLRRIDFPRTGKTGWRHWVPSWRQWLSAFGLGFALFVALFVVVYIEVTVPRPNQQALAQQSVFYYSDGKTVLARVGDTDRTSIPLADIPLTAREAVLAAEDRGFYKHGGFSPQGLLRAAYNDARGRGLEGGSTITQQLVKNYYLTQQRTVSRKVRELVVSVKLEQTTSKDQILEDYLNTIYYGRGTYGIQAASRAYFGTGAGSLTLAQGAVLAAIIQSPGNLAPETNLSGLQNRWNYVLDGMVTEGWITPAARQAVTFPKIAKAKSSVDLSGTGGYLIAEARKELATLGYTQDRIDSEGLRVVTTFDARDQAAAVAAVNAQRPTETDVHVGLASVDPATGGVLAIYGGRDFLTQQYDDATQSAPQAGSTFKPFALAAALEQGIGLASKWDGHSPQTVQGPSGPYVVTNYGGETYGRMSLLKATEDSVNTVYVPLSLQVGGAKVVDAARRAGVPASVHIDSGPTVALGTASPTALDMASAYATFAAGGIYRAPHFIKAVKKANGGIDYAAKPGGRVAFAPDIVADVDYALQKVVTDGTGFAAKALTRVSAGKTGTTNAGKSAWYDGYVPQMATAVDLFRPDAKGDLTSLDGVGGLATVTGGSFPARIWTAYMQSAMSGRTVATFPAPAFIGGSPSPLATHSASSSISASPSPTLTPSSSAPTPTPTPTPSSSAPTATPTPTVSPTVSPTPSGTQSSPG